MQAHKDAKQEQCGHPILLEVCVWYAGIEIEIGWEWSSITLPCGREEPKSWQVWVCFP